MLVRDETPGDIDAIDRITRAAFADCPYSRQTESFIIRALRGAGALTLSLVAEEDAAVVGHVAFSPGSVGADGGWHVLGPVSVAPGRQGCGIGSALIREGLARLRALGSRGCVLVGNPAYYVRFGFRHCDGLCMAGVPDEVILALPFGDGGATGAMGHHPAFSATE